MISSDYVSNHPYYHSKQWNQLHWWRHTMNTAGVWWQMPRAASLCIVQETPQQPTAPYTCHCTYAATRHAHHSCTDLYDGLVHGGRMSRMADRCCSIVSLVTGQTLSWPGKNPHGASRGRPDIWPIICLQAHQKEASSVRTDITTRGLARAQVFKWDSITIVRRVPSECDLMLVDSHWAPLIIPTTTATTEVPPATTYDKVMGVFYS